MSTAELIARFIGPVYLAVALGVLLNTDFYQKAFREFFDIPALAYVSGLLALAFGLAIGIFHNQWTAGWTVRITIVGWLGVLMGVSLTVFPAPMRALTESLLASAARRRAGMAVAFALGLFLTAKGFGLV